MDRRQARARFLIGAALLIIGAAAAPLLPIREARWVVPGSVERNLTRQPSECLAWPMAERDRHSVEIGRAAFRAPLLLGGQAARAGVSCASCHRNGRSNPDFQFPGISGPPGTADVTSSLMSKKRGDGNFNPKPIPDLAAAASGHKIPRNSTSGELKHFIHGLVVEEFDGAEPPPAVLDGLVAYVRALSSDACLDRRDLPITLKGMLADAEGAVRAAQQVSGHGDPASARLLFGAARSTLGSIDERFALPGLEANRLLLREADGELHRIQEAAGTAAEARLVTQWWRNWPRRARMLKRNEAKSLFSVSILRRQLAGRVPSRD